jgi:hypothetical protein
MDTIQQHAFDLAVTEELDLVAEELPPEMLQNVSGGSPVQCIGTVATFNTMYCIGTIATLAK